MKSSDQGASNRTARKRVLLSLVFAVLYTVGFFVAFRMAWVDFTDRYVVLESAIAHTGQALLSTLYAPVTFTRFYGSGWAFLFLFLLGFAWAWLVIWVYERCRRRKGLSAGT